MIQSLENFLYNNQLNEVNPYSLSKGDESRMCRNTDVEEYTKTELGERKQNIYKKKNIYKEKKLQILLRCSCLLAIL